MEGKGYLGLDFFGFLKRMREKGRRVLYCKVKFRVQNLRGLVPVSVHLKKLGERKLPFLPVIMA